MMRALVDTQLLVWAASNPKKLPAAAAKVFESRESDLTFSLASMWELSIKFALARSNYALPPVELRESLLLFGFKELAIRSEHVLAVSTLPHIHRDPFDRLLVAQAKLEGLTLMTADKTLAKYGDWVKRY